MTIKDLYGNSLNIHRYTLITVRSRRRGEIAKAIYIKLDPQLWDSEIEAFHFDRHDDVTVYLKE